MGREGQKTELRADTKKEPNYLTKGCKGILWGRMTEFGPRDVCKWPDDRNRNPGGIEESNNRVSIYPLFVSKG